MATRRNIVRVAVVENGLPLSGTWSLWRKDSDIYLAPRTVAGSFKVSLHASGKFRFGFTSTEKASKFLKPDQDRAVFKWTRPRSEQPSISVLMQIIFPEMALLAPRHVPKLHDKLVKLRIPERGCATVVSVIETSTSYSASAIKFQNLDTQTLARWELPDGRQVWIIEHREASAPEFIANLEALRESIPLAIASRITNPLPPIENSHLRSFVSLHSDDGVIRFVDIDAEHIRVSPT